MTFKIETKLPDQELYGKEHDDVSIDRDADLFPQVRRVVKQFRPDRIDLTAYATGAARGNKIERNDL